MRLQWVSTPALGKGQGVSLSVWPSSKLWVVLIILKLVMRACHIKSPVIMFPVVRWPCVLFRLLKPWTFLVLSIYPNAASVVEGWIVVIGWGYGEDNTWPGVSGMALKITESIQESILLPLRCWPLSLIPHSRLSDLFLFPTAPLYNLFHSQRPDLGQISQDHHSLSVDDWEVREKQSALLRVNYTFINENSLILQPDTLVPAGLSSHY